MAACFVRIPQADSADFDSRHPLHNESPVQGHDQSSLPVTSGCRLAESATSTRTLPRLPGTKPSHAVRVPAPGCVSHARYRAHRHRSTNPRLSPSRASQRAQNGPVLFRAVDILTGKARIRTGSVPTWRNPGWSRSGHRFAMSDDGVRLTVCQGLVTGVVIIPLLPLATLDACPPGGSPTPGGTMS
jgi:hypothetical protein